MIEYKYIYENSWIFKLPILSRYSAITLGPFIFFKGKRSEKLLRHELVHVDQIGRLAMMAHPMMNKAIFGIIAFFLSYGGFFIFNLFKYRNWNLAYRNIPYEVEAYK